MAREKKAIRPFTMNSMSEKAQLGAAVLNVLKKENTHSIKGISEKASVPAQAAADLINACVKKDLLKISNSPKGDVVKINEKFGIMLGIGFSGAKCYAVRMDVGGNIVSKDEITAGILSNWRGKNKEIGVLAEELVSSSSLKGKTFSSAGIAVPESMSAANPNTAEILAKELQGTLGCDIFTCNAAAAAAYGERDASREMRGKDMLYLHSDVGTGVVIKNESIFEAAGKSQGKNESYLAPWAQFSMVETAKDLVNKGIGTDIVNMVNGDVESITVEVVLKAASNDDELADDLVRRAGLALGVRAAYLVNMFGTAIVVVGGGVEGKEGGFMKYLKEGQERFLLESLKDKIEVLPGKLGREASAIGAASLCRRELFMEV